MANPTPEQILSALRQADAAGDTAGAQRLAQLYKASMAAPSANYPKGITPQAGDVVVTPTKGDRAIAAQPDTSTSPLGSDSQNFLAGVGKSFVDNGRGLAQRATELASNAVQPVRMLYHAIAPDQQTDAVLGAPQAASDALRKQQDQVAAQDAPLMNTKAGLGGDITGQAAQTLVPGAALRGLRMAGVSGIGSGLADALIPSTARGAALQGAVQGAAQPVGSIEAPSQVAQNIGTGALTGGAASAIPQVAMRGLKALSSVVAPFTDAGQEGIVANVLKKYGSGGNLTPTPSAVPGVQPTLAEATGNPGLALLQRTVQQNSPAVEGGVNAFSGRELQNNGARVTSLRKAPGPPEYLTNAIQNRADTTNPLYQAAADTDQSRLANLAQQADAIRSQGRLMPGGKASADAQANAVQNAVPPSVIPLMQRPAMQQAVKDASQLLAERGKPNQNPLTSVEGLQAVKTALDNMVNYQPGNSAATFDRNAVMGTRQDLVKALGDLSPEQAAADAKYAELSKPVNAINTGQEIARQSLSNANDSLGNPTLRNEALARAINNADQIAQRETGYAGATGENTLGATRLAQLQTLAGDTARANAGASGALPRNSATGQNIVSQHILENLTGALGVPGLAENSIAQRASRAIGNVYRVFGIPEDIQNSMHEVFLNPQSAQSQAILARIPQQQRAPIMNALAPYFGAIGDAANAERVGQQNRPKAAVGQ